MSKLKWVFGGLAGLYLLDKQMETDINWIIRRTYYTSGTNGIWYAENGTILCYTIELPDLANKFQVSCIPGHGKQYLLHKYYSPDKGYIFSVSNVPNRNGIEVHAANDKSQLLGCIAPVSQLTGVGMGDNSRNALAKLTSIAYPVLNAGHNVTLTIY